MISEPELEGGGPDDGRAERPAVPGPRTESGAPPAYDGEGPERGETIAAGAPPSAPARPRPWLWALGGAVAASAVWAGGLYAYDRIGPDLRGYAVSRNLCLEAELPALTDRLGRKTDSTAGVDETPAVDRAVCRLTLMPGGRRPVRQDAEPTAYTVVNVGYTLHKKTDPEPEFDATVTPLMPFGYTRGDAKALPGLGDRAYLVAFPSGDAAQLKVLDGRAEFTIDVMGVRGSVVDPRTGEGRDSGPLDLSDAEPDLVADMKDLMAALKK
ncbi:MULTISPECIES: hypothetical protein [unclassified Streptomyces]|uniref:hypothetical protein n=1 Tax=unclassified Streptomyces TaxID=2593676 RepID=UPI002E282594|nr:hypothetical protein [Streptomyces sp. NBC_01429]